MDTPNRTYWKCKGRVTKYDRPCPQKFFYVNEDIVSLETIQKAVEIKCPRCKLIQGGGK